ncbi:MAG: prolyl oligopeptidase family serine peptidase [Verrucomicrobiota bacterium]
MLAAIMATGSFTAHAQDAKNLARSFFYARQVQHPTLSPSGKKMAYVLRSRKQDWLWVHDIETSASRAYEQKNEIRIKRLDWLDDNTLAYDNWRQATTYLAYNLLNLRRQSTIKIEDQGKVLQIVHPLPFKQGQAIAKFPSSNELYTLDARSGELTTLLRTKEPFNQIIVDSYGTPRLGKIEGDEPSFFASSLDKWEPLETPESLQDLAIVDAGSTLLATHLEDSHFVVSLHDFPSLKSRNQRYVHDGYDVAPDAYIRNNLTHAIAGFRYQADKPTYAWIDAEYQQWHETLSAYMPGMNIEILGTDTSKRHVSAFASADNQPGHLFVLDTEDERIQTIRYSGPLLDPEELPRTMPFYFSNRNGQRVHGYITLPQDPYKKPFPLIVIARDGPQGRNTWGYDPQNLYFAKLGFAVIKVDYHGSTGYGQTHADLPLHKILELSVQDCADAARWAIQHGFADAQKVGIYGEGFGGYVALASLAAEQNLYQCAVGFGGIYDWNKHLDETSNDLAPRYKLLSPINSAESFNAAALLIHSQSDKKVSPDQSRAMHQALRREGKDSALSLTNWQPHTHLSPDSAYALYLRLATFYASELK